MLMDKLKDLLAAKHLLNHPFYQRWMAGDLSIMELQDYAIQYYTHVEAFPRYLGAVHSKCMDYNDRKIILENLNDEEGVNSGTSHPEYWMRFAEGLGLSREQILNAAPREAILTVRSKFFEYCESSLPEGVGAIYAYESQIPEIAKSKIQGLKENYQINDARTLDFFVIHQSADVYHRDALDKLIEKIPSENSDQVLNAANNVSQALWNFLSDVDRSA